MSAATAELLAVLRAQGFTLAAVGDRIRVAPASCLTAELRQTIHGHRAELLAILAASADATAALAAATPLLSDEWPCYYWPTHRRRWRSIHGVVLCGTCVPPAHPGVVAEWLDSRK